MIVAAALGLLWFAEPRVHTRPAVWYAVSAALILLGALTKAQYLVFLPACLLLVIDAHRRQGAPRARVWFVLGIGVAVALAVRVLAAHGTYTSEFELSNVPSQIRSRYFWLIVAFAIVWSALRPQAGVPWASAKGTPPPDSFRYALADERLCPALIRSAEWDAVWRSSQDGGFTLYWRRA